jgi:hypothetical protein
MRKIAIASIVIMAPVATASASQDVCRSFARKIVTIEKQLEAVPACHKYVGQGFGENEELYFNWCIDGGPSMASQEISRALSNLDRCKGVP